jgi:uncharacterized membrane protein YphA (DoxX/SURF4 family)
MLMFYLIHSFLITGLFARSVSLMLMFYFIHSFLITGLFARSVSLMLMFYLANNPVMRKLCIK